MQEIISYVSKFKSYLLELGYGKSTCYMLPNCVKDFLTCRKIKELKTINKNHIQSFYEHLEERPHKKKPGGLSEGYIHHHMYGIKLFLAWLESAGEIKENPISTMTFKKPVSKPREPLSKEETAKLFAGCTSLKETAILHLFYSCGLRKSEGEALNASDIHFKEKLLYVREGKNNKRRAIPMPEKVKSALESYLVNERKTKEEKAFILNKTGTRMKGDSFNKTLKNILRKAGIEKETSLHHLRHSIATHLLESGLSIERVRDFLGHKHLESTQVYAKVNLKRHGL